MVRPNKTLAVGGGACASAEEALCQLEGLAEIRSRISVMLHVDNVAKRLKSARLEKCRPADKKRYPSRAHGKDRGASVFRRL